MNESPQKRLDHYVGGHIDLVRKLGGEVDGSAAAQGIARILEIADREMPGTIDRAGERDPQDVLESKRLQGPEALAEQAGGEFFYHDDGIEPVVSAPKAPPPIPKGYEGEKHMAMMKRLKVLMSRIPGVIASPLKPDAEFQYPRFARLLERTTSNAQLNSPRSMGSGIYKGMALPERQRRYYRRLEQICDQSNAVVAGSGWWISK